MAKEITNNHGIEFALGFGRISLGGSSDASMDSAIQKLNATKQDGVSGEEFKELFDAMSDYGQVTGQEAQQFLKWAKDNYKHLSPEAKQMLEKIDSALQAAGHDSRGIDKLGGGDPNKIVLSGAQLDALKSEVNKIGGGGKTGGGGQPDGVDPNHGHGHGDPAPYTPSAPPSRGGSAGGAGGVGGAGGSSWREIFAMLADALSKKENEAKELGKEAAKASAGGGESGKKAVIDFQQALSEMNELFTMITNMMKSLHDTASAGIRNIAV
jgi:hypothetical protein